MKKLGVVMMYIPLVWYLVWLFAIFIFVPGYDNMDVNPVAFIKAVYYILITPATWATIVIGIIGYLLQRDSK